MPHLSLREMREKTKPNKKGKRKWSKSIKINKQTKHRLFTSNSTFLSIILAGNITLQEQEERRKVMARDSLLEQYWKSLIISNLKLVNSYVVGNSLINLMTVCLTDWPTNRLTDFKIWKIDWKIGKRDQLIHCLTPYLFLFGSFRGVVFGLFTEILTLRGRRTFR